MHPNYIRLLFFAASALLSSSLQTKRNNKMAIIVKGEITITKGFDTWKAMVKKNQSRMAEMGMVMLFAGVQKDDPTRLHAIMKFPDMAAFQAFGSNEELTEERRQAGAVVESGVMTMISEGEFFTNFPEPFVAE